MSGFGTGFTSKDMSAIFGFDSGFYRPESSNADGVIVTSGLKLSLDAANATSYPGSGTTWFDLSGNGNNATLYNTPTYTTDNGGLFSFDRNSYEYAEVTDMGDMLSWSVEAWFKLDVALNNGINAIVTNMVSSQFRINPGPLFNVNALNYSIGSNQPGSSDLVAGFFIESGGGWQNSSGFAPVVGTWYHVIGTYDGANIKLYRNGSLLNTTPNTNYAISGGNTRIARRWDSLAGPGDADGDGSQDTNNFIDGSIPVVRIYNRAITSAEVTQNFDALKWRYGL